MRCPARQVPTVSGIPSPLPKVQETWETTELPLDQPAFIRPKNSSSHVTVPVPALHHVVVGLFPHSQCICVSKKSASTTFNAAVDTPLRSTVPVTVHVHVAPERDAFWSEALGQYGSEYTSGQIAAPPAGPVLDGV